VKRHSVVICGGGPSGISTALFLVHAAPEFADRIVVLERDHYPREKYCAGALGNRADQLLASIDVKIDVPSVRIDGAALRVLGKTTIVREAGIGRVVRRLEFDHALARVAAERGIAVREGVRVLGVREHAPPAAGVTVTTSDGDVDADYVVGADGVESVVRRALGLPLPPHRAQALEVDTEHAPGDLPRDMLLFDLSRADLPGYYWEFPTIVDGRERVCRGVYYLKSYDARSRLEIDGVLADELTRRGLALQNYKKKRYAERGFAIGAPIATARSILVGEAAGIDPVTGEGIAQAIQYGAAAGAYLAKKLRSDPAVCSDWPRAVSRSAIGRDLLVRSSAVDLTFGRYRPAFERFLLDTPEFLRVGLRHFGGRRMDKPLVARAAVKAVSFAARTFVLRDGLSRARAGGLP
jgi:flavin-dependent dehydrogenase